MLLLGATGLVSAVLYETPKDLLIIYAFLIAGVAQLLVAVPLRKLPCSIPLALIAITYLIMAIIYWNMGEARYLIVMRIFHAAVVMAFFIALSALRFYISKIYRDSYKRTGITGSAIFTLLLGGVLVVGILDLSVVRVATSLELISHAVMLFFIMQIIKTNRAGH
ncbi:MAG: hypothetical protein OQL16_09720 [Gammaproteobacteria bacterium]|nr:hypothetical protein [Gammaproteobacteria bacterium]